MEFGTLQVQKGLGSTTFTSTSYQLIPRYLSTQAGTIRLGLCNERSTVLAVVNKKRVQ